MRRTVTILGTLLIAAVFIISGSAVAPFIHHYEPAYTYNCSSPGSAEGAPDGEYASLGQYGPPPVFGLIVLDFGSGNEMGPNQVFTVYALSSISETYNVSVSETAIDDGYYLGSNEDTQNHTFTTPSTPGMAWRYVIMWGWTSSLIPDYGYGPDIDAVGYT